MVARAVRCFADAATLSPAFPFLGLAHAKERGLDRTVKLVKRSLSLRWLLTIALATGLLAPPLLTSSALAQADRDPRDFVLTEEEGGGKEVIRAVDEDCSDDRARCWHIRWVRDLETDASVGPGITVNKVWVAKDIDTAKAIYKDQENLNKEMPERTEPADGPFKWEAPRDPIGAEEWAAAQACVKDRCESQGRIDLHQRIVARARNVVSMVYLFGRERNTTPELAVYFTTRVMSRV